jgi:hypothetical protein
MAKSILSADSAHFPALILLSFAGPDLPADGTPPPLAGYSALLTNPTRN